jgi:hypothetical protein
MESAGIVAGFGSWFCDIGEGVQVYFAHVENHPFALSSSKVNDFFDSSVHGSTGSPRTEEA